MKIEEFWKHTKISDRGCWEWTGTTKSHGGYGYLYRSKGFPSNIMPGAKQIRAHRLAWVLMFGIIPNNVCVLHRCDNPLCCNPEHLFLGTRADNMADMDKKHRRGNVGYKKGQQIGELNNNSKLNANKVAIIKHKLVSGELSQGLIAKEFGVSKGTINQIKSGKAWTHIKENNYVANQGS